MRAAVLHRPAPVATRPLALTEVADPEPGLHDVVIDVTACGVCRTDLQLVEGDFGARRLPIVPGHQIVGCVQAIGEAVAGRGSPRVGDRVGVAWIATTCGACRFCDGGRENLCEQATFTGWDRDGGFAERFVADHRFVYPLPAGFDDMSAAPLWWERSLRSVANVTRDDVTGLLELAPRIPLVTTPTATPWTRPTTRSSLWPRAAWRAQPSSRRRPAEASALV